MNKKYKIFLLLLIAIILSSCEQNTQQINNINPSHQLLPNTESIELSSNFKMVDGQLIYLPIYSYIYHSNQKRVHNLGITVTIHNTDLENYLIIKSLKYYDTKGNLIEDFLTSPLSLKPLASTNLYIEDNDTRGGIGANFLIEWVADKSIFDPIVEAVMVSTASTQGISFTTQGRVIKELAIKN